MAAIWLHYEKAGLTGGRVDVTVAHLYFYATTAAAAAGALALGWRALRSRRRLLPSLACASLLVPPLALKALRPDAEYVLSKLILTLAPVLVLFLACAGFAAVRRWPTRARTVCAAAGFLLVVLALQSGLEQRARLRGGNDVGSARTWNDPDMRRLCDSLRNREPADVVIALPGDGTERLPSAETGALCYYARHHRIRLAEPARVWQTAVAELPAPQLLDVSAVTPGALVVRRHGGRGRAASPGEVVATYGKYDLVRVIGPAVASRRGSP